MLGFSALSQVSISELPSDADEEVAAASGGEFIVPIRRRRRAGWTPPKRGARL